MSAFGYKRTLGWAVIYVRFTPESRHQDGCRFTSANDPQETFGLDGLPHQSPIELPSHGRLGGTAQWPRSAFKGG